LLKAEYLLICYACLFEEIYLLNIKKLLFILLALK
jgi:hypothetical protein